MTAKVVLAQKNLNLDAKVTIQKAYSDYIVSRNASSARLIVGDKVTVRQLLYGLMLPSGCDAAYALADKFGSGKTRAARVKSFVGKMNADAKKLGLKNTHFDSFDGIGNGKNYSTPRDLTKIASSAMKNSTFRSIVKTKKYTAKTKTKTGSTRTMAPWTNTNTLLSNYSGTIGVKTGSGSVSKYCLVFAATRNGKTVIGTVLASSSGAQRERDAKKLLGYGFGKIGPGRPTATDHRQGARPMARGTRPEPGTAGGAPQLESAAPLAASSGPDRGRQAQMISPLGCSRTAATSARTLEPGFPSARQWSKGRARVVT